MIATRGRERSLDLSLLQVEDVVTMAGGNVATKHGRFVLKTRGAQFQLEGVEDPDAFRSTILDARARLIAGRGEATGQ